MAFNAMRHKDCFKRLCKNNGSDPSSRSCWLWRNTIVSEILKQIQSEAFFEGIKDKVIQVIRRCAVRKRGCHKQTSGEYTDETEIVIHVNKLKGWDDNLYHCSAAFRVGDSDRADIGSRPLPYGKRTGDETSTLNRYCARSL